MYPNTWSVPKRVRQRFATKPAFTNLGKTLTYGELYKRPAHHFAALTCSSTALISSPATASPSSCPTSRNT